jgi:hypothetical protein
MSIEQESDTAAIRACSSVRDFFGMGAIKNFLTEKFAMVLSLRQDFKLISTSTIGRLGPHQLQYEIVTDSG